MSVETDDVDLVGEEAGGNLIRAALIAALVDAGACVTVPNPLPPTLLVSLQILAVFPGVVWGGASLVLCSHTGRRDPRPDTPSPDAVGASFPLLLVVVAPLR